MTRLNAHESALMLAQLSIAELYGKVDLRSQLASIRLSAAIEAMQGNVNMEEYEAKVLGRHAPQSNEGAK